MTDGYIVVCGVGNLYGNRQGVHPVHTFGEFGLHKLEFQLLLSIDIVLRLLLQGGGQKGIQHALLLTTAKAQQEKAHKEK